MADRRSDRRQAMRLGDLEKAMRDGAHGEACRWAIEQQIAVGGFFGAKDFVEIAEVHICADGEALGESGIAFLERLAALPERERRLRVPAITDPRGADFARAAAIRQDAAIVARERRLADALAALGFLLTDTCVTYQCVAAPARGQHLAYGDTGTVIQANAVQGAFSNFEGGPAALAAALTGRVPRYGFHLPEARRGTTLFRVGEPPRGLVDWGAIGALVGRRMGSYFEVPVIELAGPAASVRPGSDALKHLGAALASYGSSAMFHLVGVTPEAPTRQAAFAGAPTGAALTIDRAVIDAFLAGFTTSSDRLDVAVFAGPQLSLLELAALARLLAGRQVATGTALLVAVPPAVVPMAARAGLVAALEACGVILLEGVCFYQMHARELARANGWRTLMTNSAKLANIITGYGYEPVLAPMRACVESAIAGRILR